jgi:hypothetical protein
MLVGIIVGAIPLLATVDALIHLALGEVVIHAPVLTLDPVLGLGDHLSHFHDHWVDQSMHRTRKLSNLASKAAVSEEYMLEI